MGCKITYARGVLADLRRLPPGVQRNALKTVEKNLARPPRSGQPITLGNQRLWKYRLGDFRVLCALENRGRSVVILRLVHRDVLHRGVLLLPL